MGVHAAQITEKGDIQNLCRRVCHSHGNAQDGICSQIGFVRRSVCAEQQTVDF